MMECNVVVAHIRREVRMDHFFELCGFVGQLARQTPATLFHICDEVHCL